MKNGRLQPGVHELPQPARTPGLLTRCIRRWKRWKNEQAVRGRKLSTYVSDQHAPYTADDLRGLRQPDVFNLHWTAGFLDWQSMLPAMAAQAPLVWTLHDMSPFQGIWHYSPTPEDWTPALRRWDAQARAVKKGVLHALPEDRLVVVGPCRWIAAEACKSELMGRFEVRHIPYGVDTGAFQPVGKHVARQALGLPVDAPLVGFAAEYVLDPRKGALKILEAMKGMRTPDVASLFIGNIPRSWAIPPRTVHLGRVESARVMALFYNAVDVFVCPSLQDNLPNTVLESLACGTPVVAFDTGGLPDMVRPGSTGWLVPLGSTQGLTQMLDEVFSAPSQLRRMSEVCREVAVREYALSVQAAAYTSLYVELCQRPRKQAFVGERIRAQAFSPPKPDIVTNMQVPLLALP
jgi:glycosyltransferase involved in cell wall biosynthesis